MSEETKLLKSIQWKIKLLGWFKIPMIGYTRPRLISISDQEVIVKIKLKRRTKNHLKSMYFGALAIGGDICAGVHVFYYAEKYGKKVSFAFKDFNAQFLKRAESDVTFIMSEGDKIKEAFEGSAKTGERYNVPVKIIAKDDNNEIVAEFTLTSSLKVK